MDRKTLHWSYYNYRELPETLLDYCNEVEDLYLKENFITSLPRWFFEIRTLKFLQISGNLLENLPEEIGLFENLEFLDISKNCIEKFPQNVKLLRNLERLYMSENPFKCLPEEISWLKKLRILDCRRTSITNIPLSIGKCRGLEEVSFNDNACLYEVPAKLFSLPNVQFIYIDRCHLYYLPSILNIETLKHVRVFENENLTHYPVIYEQYIPPMLHISYPQKILFHPQPGLPQLCINGENCVLNLPRTIETLQSCTLRNPASLLELCLRLVYDIMICSSSSNNKYHNDDDNIDDDDDGNIQVDMLEPYIPHTMYERLCLGPTAYCGNGICGKPLFRECCFIVLRRFKTNQQYLFTQMFCSKDCTQLWTLHNVENYKCVWYS